MLGSGGGRGVLGPWLQVTETPAQPRLSSRSLWGVRALAELTSRCGEVCAPAAPLAAAPPSGGLCASLCWLGSQASQAAACPSSSLATPAEGEMGRGAAQGSMRCCPQEGQWHIVTVVSVVMSSTPHTDHVCPSLVFLLFLLFLSIWLRVYSFY